MVGNFIDLKTLTLEELSGVVNLYPWFASARKELCVRMARQGAWDESQYAREALYVADRGKIAALLRSSKSIDCSDEDVHELLRSLLISPGGDIPSEEPEEKVRVVGGDYFSQSQYAGVRQDGDNIFSRFAAKGRSDDGSDNANTDIAERFATETLAEIFAEQGCIEEARRIYSRLILDNPEKSAYFASLIDKLN